MKMIMVTMERAMVAFQGRGSAVVEFAKYFRRSGEFTEYIAFDQLHFLGICQLGCSPSADSERSEITVRGHVLQLVFKKKTRS